MSRRRLSSGIVKFGRTEDYTRVTPQKTLVSGLFFIRVYGEFLFVKSETVKSGLYLTLICTQIRVKYKSYFLIESPSYHDISCGSNIVMCLVNCKISITYKRLTNETPSVNSMKVKYLFLLLRGPTVNGSQCLDYLPSVL